MTYAIHEANIERLEKKLTTIANKCKKYGCSFSYKQVGEDFRELSDEYGNKHIARFVLVEAEGQALINNWRFVASIEPTAKGNIITRVDDTLEVPTQYYTSEPYCEHCKTRRARNRIYLVYNELTQEFKQVGGTCLYDYTHGLSAESVTRYLSFFEELLQCEAPSHSASVETYLDTNLFLCYAAEVIRKFGYVKTYNNDGVRQRSTASRALDYYNLQHNMYCLDTTYRKILQEELADVDFKVSQPDKMVEDALLFLDLQSATDTYMHNLITACSLRYITPKNAALLVSLFPIYYHELEHKAKQEEIKRIESVSKHIGVEGMRITVPIENTTCLASWENMYGVTYMYKLVDSDGNIFIWKTSKSLAENYKCVLTGTVKAHGEFNGAKQTELTRCKCVDRKEA